MAALVATTSTTNTPSHFTRQTWCEEERDTINVFLRMWDGKTLCCMISPKQAAIVSIEMLEQKVLDCYPDESRQNFYFVTQSKPLNETNFQYLTWSDGVTVFVQYRNKGGCFIISFTILTIIMMAIVGSFCTCGSSLLIIPILLPFLFVLPLFCL